MRVFITGGAGFIGTYLTKNLLQQGNEVIIYDAFINYLDKTKTRYDEFLNYRLKELSKATIEKGNTSDKSHLIKTLQKHKPDAVVHLSALSISTVSNVMPDTAFEANVIGTVNVLQAIREISSVKRFIFASSSMVYGNFLSEKATEEHPTNPIDIYGGTKLAGEILTKVYSSQYGITYTIIRPSAVYGPTDANRRVSQIFIENAMNNKPIALHNNGASKLDFTYVEDTANGFALALKSKNAENQTFNITAGNAHSLKEFAEILKKHFPHLELKYEAAPENEKRPERGTLDISKAKKLFNYHPTYTLEAGIKKYIEFMNEVMKK